MNSNAAEYHSALLLIATLAGLFFTYLLPPLLLFTGRPLPITFGVVAWFMMTLSYLPLVTF